VLALASLVATIAVSAPWPNGGPIPKRYTCDGADAIPPITVAAKLQPRVVAIEAVDLDAPGGTFVHWLQVGRVPGRNTFGKLGYSGPCPPRGDTPHRYVFRVYLLNRAPPLKRGFTQAQFRVAIRGRVLASGSVIGRYGRY
jgi:phosphatidylethanolamine-binding protein (PEBP) family uncharacterized protein